MKTIIMFMMLFASAIPESENWVNHEYNCYTKVVNIQQHEYILAFKEGSGTSLAVLHAESCPCKETKETKLAKQRQEQGPRLFPINMRLMKYNEQQGICPHCNKYFEFKEMQGDHIVPYSKGGKTEYSNLQMLCRNCNLKKGNKYSY